MSTAWMRVVEDRALNQNLVVEQLASLKKSLKAALEQRDWSAVRRIDRLSAQLINRLGPNDRHVIQNILKELLDIKRLYQQSITLIEKELSELSNQAF